MDRFIFKCSKKDYVEKLANEFFPMFVKILIDNNILEVLESDLPNYKKQKIYLELSDICNDLMFGYRNKKYKPLLSGMYKMLGLNKNIFKLLK